MAASEYFSLEVLWKRLTLTLREWEQKSEVSNPSGKDHGMRPGEPFCSYGLALREEILLGNSTLQYQVTMPKDRFL